MLSVQSISAKDAAGTAAYYTQLAGRDDYHMDGKEAPGHWVGGGSVALGLAGEVDKEQLQNMFEGRDPATGEALAGNAGERHKPGWDLTFSAPKSVSTAWAVADVSERSAIEDAHAAAVDAAIRFAEQHMMHTRHGAGGMERQPVAESGGTVVAVFQHSASRNGDPQLHSHCLVANMTSDGRGLDVDTRLKLATGAMYRAEFAAQLQERGFSIERDEGAKSFRLAHDNDRLNEVWSSRSGEIRDELEARGVAGGKAAAVAALATRGAKDQADLRDLRDAWRQDAAEHGYTPDSVRAQAASYTVGECGAVPRPDEIMQSLTQQHSTVSQAQIMTAAAVAMTGRGDADDAQRYAQEVMDSAVRLHGRDGQDRFTTPEMLRLESEMVDRAQAMAGQQSHRVSHAARDAAIASRTMTDEQRKAFEHVTSSRQIAVVEGEAGTGKSYMLGAAREAWEQSGYRVVGTAISQSATRGLSESAGIESRNLAQLTRDLDTGAQGLNSRTVLVVDEAGMVGSRQMADLMQRAEDAGAKLVLVGDSKQLQPIDAGGAFAAVKERIGAESLSTIQRQRDDADRQVSRMTREGRATEALENLNQRGRVHVSNDAADARRAAAAAYLSSIEQGKSSIVVSGTRKDVRLINSAIRSRLQERGAIGSENVKMTTANGERSFSTSDRVIFGEKHHFGSRDDTGRNVWNGATGTVVSLAKTEDGRGAMSVRLDHSGQVVRVDPAQMDKVDHGYATTVHKAQGATVDHAHWVTGSMSGREMSYVAVTRAREETHVYTTRDQLQRETTDTGHQRKSELERDMARSSAKDTSTAYQVREGSDRDQASDRSTSRVDRLDRDGAGERMDAGNKYGRDDIDSASDNKYVREIEQGTDRTPEPHHESSPAVDQQQPQIPDYGLYR